MFLSFFQNFPKISIIFFYYIKFPNAIMQCLSFVFPQLNDQQSPQISITEDFTQIILIIFFLCIS